MSRNYRQDTNDDCRNQPKAPHDAPVEEIKTVTLPLFQISLKRHLGSEMLFRLSVLLKNRLDAQAAHTSSVIQGNARIFFERNRCSVKLKQEMLQLRITEARKTPSHHDPLPFESTTPC